jgi:precorrin-6y C5,15-methyltransferase (decarboxylating) CbiE subunit
VGPEDGPAEPIAIVGLLGGEWFGRRAEAAVRSAGVLIGNDGQFALLDPTVPGERVTLWGDLGAVLDFAVDQRAAGRRPCILADGDPGYRGVVRTAARRLGEDGIAVHPAPSSVALACARLGIPWDDAVVVTTRGRTVDDAVAAVREHPKVAVLVAPDTPPQALGAALVAAGCDDRTAAVCSRLNEPDEHVTRTDVAGLAAGTFDPRSVVVVRAR